MTIRRRPSAARKAIGPIDELSGTMVRGLRDALRNAPIKSGVRKRLEAMGLIKKLPDRFSQITPLGLRVLREATLTQTKDTTDDA